MITAVIYKIQKSPTQSGSKGSNIWMLSFVQDKSRNNSKTTGWNSNSDMLASELNLEFKSQEMAENYAKRKNIYYKIILPNKKNKNIKYKTYSENFL